MENPVSPEQKPNFLRKILKRIAPSSTKAPKTPASINKTPASENIAPVTTDQPITAEAYDDPVRLRFREIMSKVSPEMDTAWRLWAGSDEDRRTYPALWRELQKFGILATKDAQYQHELHQLIHDRFGSNPITVYHPISMGGSVLEGRTGFMPGTTSLRIAKFYARSGNTSIETLVIQPDDIKAIGSISESEVIFIPRQATPAPKIL